MLATNELALLSTAWPLTLWYNVWPYLLMLLGFSVIVFVHELGHFAVAKWAGIRVEKFAIGFGKEVFGFSRGETRYSFNFLPLGGYVKMLGQEDFDDKANELVFKDDPRSFVNKPISSRMAVVSAGVIMNVLFAGFLFMIVFMIGMEGIGTHIGFVEPDSPAHKAGLLAGDHILRINDEKMLEFRDISMAIMLSPPHQSVDFLVERDGEVMPPLQVRPDYRMPGNTRDVRRQTVGILYGFTREITWAGPNFDRTDPTSPRPGDMIVEIDGVPIDQKNVNQMREILAYAKEVYVERRDSDDPDSPPQRLRIRTNPQLAFYPAENNNRDSIGILGMSPLFKFNAVDRSGRAYLAGIEVGDTVLSWDDVPHPTHGAISRAVHDRANQDIAFSVQKPDGRVVTGFVRPKTIRYGAGTVQATCKSIQNDKNENGEARAEFRDVQDFGIAHDAGISSGDRIVNLSGSPYPTSSQVNKTVRVSAGTPLAITVQKSDGRIVDTTLVPQEGGSIDASYVLVADDNLTVGNVAPTAHGVPTPAQLAGIKPGSKVVTVAGTSVSTWGDLIDSFRSHAGRDVHMTLVNASGQTEEATLAVPHTVRTLLDLGPESRILSIDGQRTITAKTRRGEEEVHVGYHVGTRTALSELIGRDHVAVEYRANAIEPSQTGYIDVTADMVDPWLGRVAFAPSFDVGPERTLLKGENAFEAVTIGIHKTYQFILNVYTTLRRMIFSRTIGAESMSGPLGIVSIGGKIARSGLVEFLYFLAIISANLAVINFLPLPIVDGGLMVFLIIEKIKGGPVSLRVQVATQMVGLFLIAGIFLFVTYNDALRLLG